MLEASEIKDLFYYDNGELYWKPRDESIPSNKQWNGKNANKKAGRKTRDYKSITIYGKSYMFHRVVWAYFHSEWPNITDHINQDKSDNRIENLRNVDMATNNKNQKPRSNTGYKNIYLDKRKNTYSIKYKTTDGKNKGSKTFKELKDAVEYWETIKHEHGYI